MTATAFSHSSTIPPNPNRVDHGNNTWVVYTCHMAVMHWAFMAIAKNQADAHVAVREFSLLSCPGCNGTSRNRHISVSAVAYAKAFCNSARQIRNRSHLDPMVEVGDVLITRSKLNPSHTMVVRQQSWRCFNYPKQT